MNKRDIGKLDGLLLKLTAHFADPLKQSIDIFRGDGRAIVALIRERNKIDGRVEAGMRERKIKVWVGIDSLGDPHLDTIAGEKEACDNSHSICEGDVLLRTAAAVLIPVKQKAMSAEIRRRLTSDPKAPLILHEEKGK